jgi:hypothetical protein
VFSDCRHLEKINDKANVFRSRQSNVFDNEQMDRLSFVPAKTAGHTARRVPITISLILMNTYLPPDSFEK